MSSGLFFPLKHLVIEIVSPSQSIYDLMFKANKFINTGIPMVWTIKPYGNLIYISTLQGRKVELAGTLESEGIIVDFVKIFLKNS
jgi:Uma2 family endonuclease